MVDKKCTKETIFKIGKMDLGRKILTKKDPMTLYIWETFIPSKWAHCFSGQDYKEVGPTCGVGTLLLFSNAQVSSSDSRVYCAFMQ